MDIIIGSARHDEKGRYIGGAVGDNLQTSENDYKGEVSLQKFYVHSKGWVILRANDVNLANGLAFCMALACANKHIGYDQGNRLGAYTYGVLTEKDTEADCSGLVRACLKQCGHDVPDFTTANEANVLLDTLLFKRLIYKPGMEIYNGDILVTRISKGHTAIVVSGNPRHSTKPSGTNPYTEPTENIKKGSKGEGVKWVQFELNRKGANLIVDGEAGAKTDLAIRAYQKAYGLTADGIVGTKTRRSLKSK